MADTDDDDTAGWYNATDRNRSACSAFPMMAHVLFVSILITKIDQ